MALSSGKKTRLPRPDPKSTLLQLVLKQVVTLPLERQDSLAIEILDSLAKADPKSARFRQLIENKYTTGLSAEECAELEVLEADFRSSDETFYGPILERIERSESSRDTSIPNAIEMVASQYHLTDREQEVLRGIAIGLTSKETAERMNISPNTVKSFRHIIMIKMGAGTRSGIVGKVLEYSNTTPENAELCYVTYEGVEIFHASSYNALDKRRKNANTEETKDQILKL